MNTPLPQLTFARRSTAFAAAVLVTVATLATIDRLANPDRAAPLMARVHASAAV
jgi:hypothetical protein